MRRKRDSDFGENGFEKWGGYMNAKIAKLEDQYSNDAVNEENKLSDIFKGISIFVNGYTKPSANQLKCLMSEHGGTYHHYFRSNKTNYIIASNLADTKIKNLPSKSIVKPEWISDSVKAGVLLDYKNYLLYSNLSKTQPSLNLIQNKNATVGPKSRIKLDEESNSSVVDSKINEGIKEGGEMKTAVDPKFLNEFYNNSRLHHISQLGSTFKEYVNEMRNMSDFTFPLRDRLRKNNSPSENFQCPVAQNKVIMHIDMDCFFVSVGLRKHPELKGQPVAVAHAKTGKDVEHRESRKGVNRKLEFEMYRKKRNRNIMTNVDIDEDVEYESRIDGISDEGEYSSMSEIASCSYEARAMGVRNGMFMGAALRLCPKLKTIPYDFENYKEVAYELYNTIAQYTLNIEAVSCDEMYVECTELLKNLKLKPLEFATKIREEIREKTQCNCSVGFGANRLQARLATKKAKPNGQFYLITDDLESFFLDLPLAELPGVGRQMQHQLKELGYTTCGSLQSTNLNVLKKHFGNKTGQLLFDSCRGVDTSSLNFNSMRKSVSASANYGIRFTEKNHCEDFLKQLCIEVHSRMLKCNVAGKNITLKVMAKAENAPAETAKFMGHGICDNFTKSVNITTATDNLDVITKEVIKISHKLNIKPEDWRGVSIQISKLITTEPKDGNNGIQKFFNNNIDKNLPKINNTIETKHIDLNEKKSEKIDKSVIDNISSASSINERVISKKSGTLGVRRRGRPPKNSTHNIIINPTEKNKSLRNKSPVISSTKISEKDYDIYDLDKEVLNALPDEIKHEILANIKQYALVKKQYNDKKDESKIKIKDNPPKNEIVKKCSEAIASTTPDMKNADTDLLNLHWKEIRDMLKIWMKSDCAPLQCDIALVIMYVENLITTKKIEDAYCLINFTYRISSSLKRCDWHKAYVQIVKAVQNNMILVYGKKMSISNNFSCCSIES